MGSRDEGISNKIHDFFASDKSLKEEDQKWSHANAVESSKQLGGLLFMFAKNKIAESLKSQINRHFFDKLKEDLSVGSKDEAPEFLPFMKEMNSDHFECNLAKSRSMKTKLRRSLIRFK